MKTIEEAIFARINGDSTLQTLLTGSGRIVHALESAQAQVPSLAFLCLSSIPGDINSDTVQTMEDTYIFMIFSDAYVDIAYRLRVLLDGYRFSATAEAGNISSFWESDASDLFDEALQIGRKDVRYRVYFTPKGVVAA